MSARKLERLVNLLLMLLSARRPLTVAEIREMHPAYDQADDEAFRRMFERDKDELRELGVPLETAWTDAWETDQGYLVRREEYALPPIELTQDESAALALAARLWNSAGFARASADALMKLRAAGIEADPVATTLVEPHVATSEAAFEPILAAVRSGTPIAFGYRTANAPDATDRTVEPWGLVHRKGRWYVAGHDRDRDATRVFRLSRVAGPVRTVGQASTVKVPPNTDLRAIVASTDETVATGEAVVRVAPDRCGQLRRAATATVPDRDGWDRCTIPLADLDRAADWIVGYGPDAIVESPAELRDAVVGRLRDLVATS